ncbi:MAG: helix-turn-helix transcriptional regulator [Actinomycetota bacterium]
MGQGRNRGRSTKEREALLGLLRELRLEAGLRQGDLAKRLHRNQTFVSKYELGERRLDLLDLREVCRALDVSLQQFVRRFEARTRR